MTAVSALTKLGYIPSFPASRFSTEVEEKRMQIAVSKDRVWLYTQGRDRPLNSLREIYFLYTTSYGPTPIWATSLCTRGRICERLRCGRRNFFRRPVHRQHERDDFNILDNVEQRATAGFHFHGLSFGN